MPGTRTRPARRAPRAFGLALVGAPFLLVAFVACDGGAPGDADGGAGNGSDAGGEGSDGSGAASSGGNGSGGGSGGANGSGGAASNVEPIELGEYCARRSDLYFDYLVACYGSRDFPEEGREEYVTGITARCMNAEGAIEAGRLDYDAALAAECVAALEETDCVAGPTRPTCEAAFEGQSDPGDDCYPEETQIFLVGVSTCQGGECGGEACPGTCEDLPATGEDCAGTCEAGNYCNPDGECQTLPGVGDTCPDGACVDGAGCRDGTCLAFAANSDAPCGDDVLCGGPTVCYEGTCRSSVDVGGPCGLPLHCPSPSTCRQGTCQLPGDEGADCIGNSECGEGLYCPFGDESVCTPFPEVGEVCAGESSIRCAPGQACIQGSEELEAHCRARVPAGESCEDGYELCEDGVYCDAERNCAPPGSVGDSCWSVHPCEEGLGCHCGAEDTEDCMNSQQDDGDTCQPLLADGEPCFTFHECESGDCDFSASGATAEPGECITRVAEVCLP